MSTSNPRAALEAQIAAADTVSFAPLIAPLVEFAPVAGANVETCLDSCSCLLGGAEHLARLIADGDKEDAQQTAYCLSFLIEAAKSLVDTANTRLNMGVTHG